MTQGALKQMEMNKSISPMVEDVHLLAHPDWANDLILLDWLSRQSSLSTCCKYVLVYFSIEIDFIRISSLALSFTDSLAPRGLHIRPNGKSFCLGLICN